MRVEVGRWRGTLRSKRKETLEGETSYFLINWKHYHIILYVWIEMRKFCGGQAVNELPLPSKKKSISLFQGEAFKTAF